jgi:hypothetical protein
MVVSGHHIHALWWGPQASSKWSSCADIYDEKAMPRREPCVGATSRTCAHTVGYGFGSLGGASPLVPADPRSTAAVRAWVPSDRAAGFLEKLRCTTQIGFPSGGLA